MKSKFGVYMVYWKYVQEKKYVRLTGEGGIKSYEQIEFQSISGPPQVQDGRERRNQRV